MSFILVLTITLLVYYLHIYINIRKSNWVRILKRNNVYTIPSFHRRVNGKEFLIYAYLVKKIRTNFKHPLCEDIKGWLHFCLYTASLAFRQLELDKENKNYQDDTPFLEKLSEIALDKEACESYLNKILFYSTKPVEPNIHPNIPEGYFINAKTDLKIQCYHN